MRHQALQRHPLGCYLKRPDERVRLSVTIQPCARRSRRKMPSKGQQSTLVSQSHSNSLIRIIVHLNQGALPMLESSSKQAKGSHRMIQKENPGVPVSGRKLYRAWVLLNTLNTPYPYESNVLAIR
jgi:hypothetical protein